MKTPFTGIGVVASMILLVAGCAQNSVETMPARASFSELRAELDVYLDACSGTAGADPRGVEDVGDYELVPNERAWLDCAYEGVERIMIPGSSIPEMYRNLIAESRALTNLVERGEVTREQRQMRIDELVADIEDAELTGLIARELEQSEEQRRANEEELRRAFDEVRHLALPRNRR